MQTRMALVRVLWTLALLGCSLARSEVYYQNNFEEACPLVFWASSAKVKVHEIGLATYDPYEGKRCAKISFEVLSGQGWCYFKIPFDLNIENTKTYVLEAAIKYQSTNPAVRVGFGHSWWHMPQPPKKPVQGNGPSAGYTATPGRWALLAGHELAAAFREAATTAGFGPECKCRFDALYVHTEGIKPGDKVTVWVDSVCLRSATEADALRWQKEKRPVEYTPPPYPKVEDTCPWGVCGSLEFHDGLARVPFEIEAAIAAHSWAEFGFDTSLRAGGMVMAPGNPKSEDYLGQFLDIHHKYGIRCLPSTYLTGYYNRHIPKEQCESAIRRVVPRYRNHPALLAWWMIDEPLTPIEDVRDHWVWGKQIFESLDPEHPALGAFCCLPAVKLYSQYTQVALIDCYPLQGTPQKPTGSAITIAKWLEQAWECGARRIWAVPQAFGELPPWRIPTPAELRLMTWLYLSRGSTGFLFYAYTSSPAWVSGHGHSGLVDIFGLTTAMGEEVKRLAQILPALCPVLLRVRWSPTSEVRVECEMLPDGNPVFDTGFLKGAQYDIVVISNLDTAAPRRGRVIVPSRQGNSIYDLRRLEPVAIDAGAVPLQLDPGDAAVLLLGDQKAFDAAKAVMLERKQAVVKRQAQAASARAAMDSLCATRLAKATTALSRASRNLELYVLRTWPSETQADRLKAMRANAVLMGHVNALKEMLHCQHLLFYALLVQKTRGIESVYQDFEPLAEAVERGVAAFVEQGAPPLLDSAKTKQVSDLLDGIFLK